MIQVFENRLISFLKIIKQGIENSLILFSITKIMIVRTVSFSFSNTCLSVFKTVLKNTIL